MSGSAPRTDGDSALVIEVPEAEPVVGSLRLRHDPPAAHGVAAHVTILYPFVPRCEIDAPVRADLASVFSPIPAFAYRFERVVRLGPTTVVLDPDPAEPFRELTDAVHRRWPEHPPYGGVFDVVIPHLTVGDQIRTEFADDLEAATRGALEANGPVAGRATSVSLIVMDGDGEWSTDNTYPLGAQAR